jgi:putative sterol carrier protein
LTVGYFDNPDEVYKYIGGVFKEAAVHPTQGPKMAAAGITMQLHYSDPECLLTAKFHEPQLETIEGDTDEPIDVHLYMRADDADKFWRGEYNLAVGLAKGQVRAKGPVNKILKLVPLTKPMFPIYKDLVSEKDKQVAAA